jgi:tetratricopeptide (TPR) repeat protein
MHRNYLMLVLGLLLGATSGIRVAGGDEADPLLGKALSTLFNPGCAPNQKTMGLLQRSFLDLVEESRPKLQIALVVDGTTSMGAELESVRKSIAAMMGDLELYKANSISYQLVIYRDAGSPSGEVQLPLDAAKGAFVDDRDALVAAVSKVEAESGAPYFPELIDAGLHAALTQLAWSTDDDTSRWIFLFGDAPPFDESFEEPQNQAARRFGAGALISLAMEKGVRINCILCKSRPEDQAAYEKVLPQTRDFMNDLSSKTEGLMLDLSYADIRAAVEKAAPARRVSYEKVGAISRDEVEALRKQADASKSVFSAGRRVRIAVLPHLPLDNMSFAPASEAVQLATELRMRLRGVPGVEFKDPITVQQRFEMLTRQGLEGDALLQMLATALNVDFVIWGGVDRTGGAIVANSAVYDRATGRRLSQAQAATNDSVKPEQLGGMLASKLVDANLAATADQRLKAVFTSFAQDQDRRAALIIPVAGGEAYTPLLEGKEALEQALAYPVGRPEAVELLATAAEALSKAAAADEENPLPHFLLASCLYNQARAEQDAGDVEGARKTMRQFAQQLREAYRHRGNRKDAALTAEIEADFALLIRGNAADAVKRYEALLAEDPSADVESARRAHWMLAGIFSGDWGVDKSVVDRSKARDHLKQLLALWPDSHEATLIKQALRWDDAKGRTRFEHVPKENGELTAMIDRSA